MHNILIFALNYSTDYEFNPVHLCDDLNTYF